MAIKVGFPFKRTSAAPIDESLTLTKAQMLAVSDDAMPDKYFCVCLDDGKLYVYDKNATPNAETGKFSLYANGEEYDDTELNERMSQAEDGIANRYTKTETDAKIDEKLADFDKLDYKVADSAPTATKVVIKGEEVDVVEGTRYLVEIVGENKFEEYVVLDGKVYDLGNSVGSGSTELESALVVSNPLGKYTKDEEIPSGTSWEAIVRGILSKTYYPTLTAPSAGISFSLPSLAKVGQQIASGAATVSFNRGSINPQYTSESQYRAGEATGYSVTLANASVEYSDNNATGSFTVPAFTRNSKGMVTLNATVSHAAGVQPKDSDGGNYQSALGAGSVSASKSVEFILPFVWGVSATATITDFTGLVEDLRKRENRTYSYTTNNEHMVFAYDSSYPDLTSILDPNNFETISGWTASTLTVDGQQYKVYVAELATTDAGASYTFKF